MREHSDAVASGAVAGWERMEAIWWPEIAAALPRPWPEAAIRMDLRWWAARERMHGVARPGRAALVETWGVSDWAARRIMRDVGAWSDPAILQRTSSAPPADLQPTSSAPPADLQPTSSRDYSKPALSADFLQRTSSAPPADLQRTSSAPPADLQRTSSRALDTQAQAQAHPRAQTPTRNSSVSATLIHDPALDPDPRSRVAEQAQPERPAAGADLDPGRDRESSHGAHDLEHLTGPAHDRLPTQQQIDQEATRRGLPRQWLLQIFGGRVHPDSPLRGSTGAPLGYRDPEHAEHVRAEAVRYRGGRDYEAATRLHDSQQGHYTAQEAEDDHRHG